MENQTIQATVNPRLLQKASRLFTGKVEGRIIEILQNARRAGATEVHITHQNGSVIVRDNGRGIDDFAKLLDLGDSGWEHELEASEDPAGVGVFCLAPRKLTVRSQGKRLTIPEDGWTGTPVLIEDDPVPIKETELRFPDEEWNYDLVSRHAVFTGLTVFVDGKECPRRPFVAENAAHYPDLGCRIEVRFAEKLDDWHRGVQQAPYRCYGVFVNFHGQVVGWDHRPIGDYTLRCLVDLTGEPTGIRLMLPARTQLVENDALKALTAAIEVEAFRFIAQQPSHNLSYKQFLRAKELGISLPEAKPTFNVGLLNWDLLPEPVEVNMPKDFPLGRCYRYHAPDTDYDDVDAANIHLLAALGKLEQPFVPGEIDRAYDGYSWTRLPTVDKVEVKLGKLLHEGSVWCGQLNCVESITITAHTSDGKRFSSPVCMAILPPQDKGHWMDTNRVFVTPQARERLVATEIWYHLGGYSDEGDTYETQETQFSNELERFWADFIGPDENLRQSIIKAMDDISAKWKRVTVTDSGAVTIHFKNGSTKLLAPPSTTLPSHQS